MGEILPLLQGVYTPRAGLEKLERGSNLVTFRRGGPHLKTPKSTNSPPTLHYITYTHTHTHTHTHSHTHTPQREQTYRPNPALIVPVADLWLHQLFYLPAALPKLPGLQGEGSHSVSKLGFLFFHLAALDLSCHTWDLVP